MTGKGLVQRRRGGGGALEKSFLPLSPDPFFPII